MSALEDDLDLSPPTCGAALRSTSYSNHREIDSRAAFERNLECKQDSKTDLAVIEDNPMDASLLISMRTY